MTALAPVLGRLAGFTVAITASRRAREFGAALERQGATVQYAPAVRIVPLAEDTRLRETSQQMLARGVDIVVATTGIGFRGWLEAAETWGLAEQLLSTLRRAELIARGPKVKGAIRAAGLKERWAPESESTNEVLEHLLSRDLHGKRLAVQLHGEPLGWFLNALRAAGATVIEVPVYRSELPDDTTPLKRLIHSIANRWVDCIAFTSAAASANFLRIVPGNHRDIRRAMTTQDVLAACVGPVTAAPLTSIGIPVIQPDRFRLGALVKEIAEQLPQRRTRTVQLTGHTMEIRGQAILLDNALVPIGGTGTAVLRKLAEQPGRVVPRTELLRSLPGRGTDGHAVEAAISRLRAQLDDPQLIQTVVKRGYRLASLGHATNVGTSRASKTRADTVTSSHVDGNTRTVSDVMIAAPKTHQHEATIGTIRAALEDPHVHMILLTRDGVLHGTLVRDDIPAAAPNPGPALELASLRGRTIAPTETLDAVWQRLEASGQRRIAVVDDANTLLGLVCLKRDRTGFCTDDDVRSRIVERELQRTRSSS